MTIEELKNENNFLEGLRKGEYCLVLGAGFSFGLKNKTTPDSLSVVSDISYKKFKTIPLVKAYVSLTNKIFNSTTNKGVAAANIWENNNFSANNDGKPVDLKNFMKTCLQLMKIGFWKTSLKIIKTFYYQIGIRFTHLILIMYLKP